LLSVVLLPFAGADSAAESVFHARVQLDRKYAEQLEQLAVWCDQQGLASEGRRTRDWLPSDRDQRFLLFDPTQAPEQPPANELPAAAEWRHRFGQLRAAQARELFALARQAALEQRPVLGMELIGNTLREDPDHEEARAILGYRRQEGAWHTSFTLARQKAGQVWDDRFGWILKSRLARYAAGERYHRGRWISAEQDARLHATIDTGWELETEHFSVVTNHSLEAAARFGRLLEALQAAFEQVCMTQSLLRHVQSMRNSPPQIASSSKRHEVMVFRNRDEYQRALRGEIPDEVTTTGFYASQRRTAYFYVPDAAPGAKPAFDDTVLYHEAVHQLFNETTRSVPAPGEKHNFWLIEGIACYFESLAQRDGYLTLGGTQAERFRAARYRFVNDSFYVPLEGICRMDRQSLQRDPRIARLYSQAAGLTHFLMHSAQGGRRDGLLSALNAVYAGRDRLSTLPECLGEDFKKLDDAYGHFLRQAGPE
jgi:hypothetical protein